MESLSEADMLARYARCSGRAPNTTACADAAPLADAAAGTTAAASAASGRTDADARTADVERERAPVAHAALAVPVEHANFAVRTPRAHEEVAAAVHICF